MTASITISLGEQDYEVFADYYHFGSAPRGWDPGDGDELEIANIVKVHFDSSYSDVTTLDAFLLSYAAAHLVQVDMAEATLRDLLLEAVAEDYAARRDHEMESRYEC